MQDELDSLVERWEKAFEFYAASPGQWTPRHTDALSEVVGNLFKVAEELETVTT